MGDLQMHVKCLSNEGLEPPLVVVSKHILLLVSCIKLQTVDFTAVCMTADTGPEQAVNY